MESIIMQILEKELYYADGATLPSVNLFDENGEFVTDAKILEQTQENIKNLVPLDSEWVYAIPMNEYPNRNHEGTFLLNTRTGMGFPLDKNGERKTSYPIYFNEDREFRIESIDLTTFENALKKVGRLSHTAIENEPRSSQDFQNSDGDDGLLF